MVNFFSFPNRNSIAPHGFNNFNGSEKRTSNGKASDLRCEDKEHASNKGLLVVVPQLLQDDNVNSIGGTLVTGDHSSDEHVLLDVEGTGVERELQPKEVELVGGEDTGHEVTHGKREKGDDRVTDRNLGLTEVKELVDKRDDAGPEKTEEPHAESVVRQRGVIRV